MLTIDLDVPAALWLTANGREHWREKARRTKALRTLAYAHCTPRTTRFDGPVDVTATISYPTARRADPSNAAPTVKAILDGIVDSGLLVDDDHRHVPAVTYRRGDDTKTRGLYIVRIDLTPTITCPSCRRYGTVARACPVCLGYGHIVEREVLT